MFKESVSTQIRSFVKGCQLLLILGTVVLASCVATPEQEEKQPDWKSSGGSSNLPFDEESNLSSVSMDMTVLSQSLSSNPSFTFSVEFSESVEDFTKWDMLIDNGYIRSFSGQGDLYFVEVEALSSGTVSVDVKEGALGERPILNNVPFQDLALDYDSSGPTPEFSQTGGTATLSDPTSVLLTFDEDVSGLESSDFDVTNGHVSEMSTNSESSYSLEVVAYSTSTVTVQLKSGAVVDDAGNSNTETPSISFDPVDDSVDTEEPVASLSTSSAVTDNPISVAVNFSENVEVLEKKDFQVINGSISSFSTPSVPTTSHSFQVTPTVQGDVTVRLLAGSVEDASGNPIEQEELVHYYDEQTITAELSLNEVLNGESTNYRTVSGEIVFSEDVTDVSTGDFSVANGTMTSLTGDGDTYNFLIEADSDNESLTLSFDGNVEDLDGVTPSVSVSTTPSPYSWTVDADRPNAVIAFDSGSSPKNSAPIPMTVEFRDSSSALEGVTGFHLEDMNLTNATIVEGSFSSSSSAEYSFEVMPSTQGDIAVSIPSGAAQDGEGNLSNADSFDFIFDSEAPTATLSWGSFADEYENQVSDLELKVEFSEPLPPGELTLSDFNNGGTSNVDFGSSSLSRSNQDDVYVLHVVPNADGAIAINLPNTAITDRGGYNIESQSGPSLSVTYDSTPPTVGTFEWNGGVTDGGYTNSTSMSIDIQFSEEVMDLTKYDFQYTNVSLSDSSLSKDSATDYTLTIEPASIGVVEVHLPVDGAFDRAGNGNDSASPVRSVTYDPNPPLPTLTWADDVKPYEASSPMTLEIEFSKPATGLSVSDFEFSNVDAGPTSLSGSGTDYTLEVVPSSEGELTVSLPADSVQDSAGNGNDPSNTASVNYEPTFLRHYGTNSVPNDSSSHEMFSATAVDSQGAVYSCGHSEGDFVSTGGGLDAIVTKTNADGTLEWAEEYRSNAGDVFYAAAVDSADNIYCAGYSYGDFNETSGGNSDVIIVKLSSSGTLLWKFHMGDSTAPNDSSDQEMCRALDTDSNGNVYCTGYTQSNYGSFAGTDETGNDGTHNDIFVLKVNSSGTLQWVTQIGSEAESSSSVYDTSSNDYGWSIYAEDTGDVYVGGTTYGDLGGTSAGGGDAYMLKLDNAGDLQWLTHFGDSLLDSAGSGHDQCRGIDLDDSGNVYCGGYTQSDLDEPNGGGYDAVIFKVNASGSPQWISQLGSNKEANNPHVNNAGDNDYIKDLVIDNKDRVFFAGETRGDLAETSAGGSDAYVGMMDTGGTVQWLTQAGADTAYSDASSSDQCNAVGTDNEGGVFCAGYTFSDYNEPNGGSGDAFIWKLTVSGDSQ